MVKVGPVLLSRLRYGKGRTGSGVTLRYGKGQTGSDVMCKVW